MRAQADAARILENRNRVDNAAGAPRSAPSASIRRSSMGADGANALGVQKYSAGTGSRCSTTAMPARPESARQRHAWSADVTYSRGQPDPTRQQSPAWCAAGALWRCSHAEAPLESTSSSAARNRAVGKSGAARPSPASDAGTAHLGPIVQMPRGEARAPARNEHGRMGCSAQGARPTGPRPAPDCRSHRRC